MAQITYSVSFWTQFLVSHDLFTDLTKGEAKVLSYRGNLQQPVEFKTVPTEK